MPDPTGAASAAVGAGVGAVFVAVIGVEPQVLVWSFVGAVFGVPFAPPAGRMRSILVFLSTVMACALLGSWAAENWHAGSHRARDAWAMGLGVVFHPLLATLVQMVPSVVQALVQAIVRAKTNGGQP